MPKGLLLMMTDIDPANEADFNRWYGEEHLDERMAIPGFISARRFTALEGGPKYLALYDLEIARSASVGALPAYRWTGKSAWTSGWKRSSSTSAATFMCGLSERKR